MKLTKIDLSQIVAVGHQKGRLGLLVDRGTAIEYLEIPAPEVAYYGLQQISHYADVGEDENEDPVIELECDDQQGYEYSAVILDAEDPLLTSTPCDQLLNFQVPGYHL